MSERLVQGEEMHMSAQQLIRVLGMALVAAARGQWDETAEHCVDAIMLAERLKAAK